VRDDQQDGSGAAMDDGRTIGASVRARLAAVRLLSVDVDGVLTDGGIYVADDGRQMRKFNVKDGMGLQLVQQAGIAVAVVTAGTTGAIRHRIEGLGIRHLCMGVEDKLAALDVVRAELGVEWPAVAHIGDDINDLPVLGRVGCPLTVADGIDAARAAAIHVTARRGGDGAVREICDLLLRLRQS